MSCTHGKPDCGRASAPGYNPLQLCAEHLAAYRAITKSSRPVGEGSNEPRKEYKPMYCNTCHMGLCHLAKSTEKSTTDGGLIVNITAPRTGCPHLRGETPPAKEPAKKSRKRSGPPGLFG